MPAVFGTQAPIPGYKFVPHWGYIRLISFFILLAYAFFAKKFFTENLFCTDQPDPGHPHRLKLKLLLSKFCHHMLDWGSDFYPK
jgi:hypothetical protein